MILDASLEVRSPIVYATLIIVAAAVPIFLLPGLTGSFFRPLAVSYTLAIVASMAVALTVTPALALILLRQGARRAPRITAGQVAAARSTAPCCPASSSAPASAYAALRRARADRLCWSCLTSGSRLFPTFKERDFLIHFLAAPGTSTAGEARMIKRQKDLRAIPGVRTSAPTSARRSSARRSPASTSARTGSASTTTPTTTRPSRDPEVVDSYPGVYRDVLTYLNERIEEVLTGRRSRSSSGSTARTWPSYGQGATSCSTSSPASRASSTTTSTLQVDQPQIQVEVDLAKAAQVRAETRRRATGGSDPGGRRGGG